MRKRFSVVMGKMCFLTLAIVFATTGSAQLQVGGFTGAMTLSARGGFKLPNMENVDGSPYLDNQFHSARIRTKSGFDTSGVQVKFNAYGNEMIYIELGGIELALDSLDMVSYAGVENGSITEFVFKSGFPNIDGFTSHTLYRVLASGPKYQLLKHISKRLEDVKSMGEYNKKEFVLREQLYLYSPTAGIKKVKADKKAVQEAFPELSQQVESLVAEKKLKLKKESDFALLIEELNKP